MSRAPIKRLMDPFIISVFQSIASVRVWLLNDSCVTRPCAGSTSRLRVFMYSYLNFARSKVLCRRRVSWYSCMILEINLLSSIFFFLH